MQWTGRDNLHFIGYNLLKELGMVLLRERIFSLQEMNGRKLRDFQGSPFYSTPFYSIQTMPTNTGSTFSDANPLCTSSGSRDNHHTFEAPLFVTEAGVTLLCINIGNT